MFNERLNAKSIRCKSSKLSLTFVVCCREAWFQALTSADSTTPIYYDAIKFDKVLEKMARYKMFKVIWKKKVELVFISVAKHMQWKYLPISIDSLGNWTKWMRLLALKAHLLCSVIAFDFARRLRLFFFHPTQFVYEPMKVFTLPTASTSISMR